MAQEAPRSEWIFDRLHFPGSGNSLDRDGQYGRIADIIEKALADGEPERVAAERVAHGEYGFIAASGFMSFHVPGVVCSVAIAEEGGLIAQSFSYDDVLYGGNQTRMERAQGAYTDRFNRAVISDPRTPFRDVCKSAVSGHPGSANINRPYEFQLVATKSGENVKASPKEFDASRPIQPLGKLPDNPDIHTAARLGLVSVLKKHIASGIAVDDRDGFGMTPLGWAALRGHKDAMDLLLSAGADIERQSGVALRPPLIWAVYSRRTAAVKFLLSRHADPNASSGLSDSDWPPIPRVNTLMMAAARGDIGIARILLRAGANPNLPDEGSEEVPNSYPASPLIFAVKSNQPGLVKLLLDRGADPNFANWRVENKITALGAAAEQGYQEIFDMLIKAGADLNLHDPQGEYSALHRAIKNKQLQSVRKLIELGADPNVGRDERASQKSYGESPLHIAAFHGGAFSRMLKWLIDAGADINEVSSVRKDTALAHAAAWIKLENVRALLKAGARPDVSDYHGQTALFRVASGGNERGCGVEHKHTDAKRKIVEALLQAGASAKHRDHKGETALFQMCAHLVGDLLLNAGADVNAQDQQGRTPLMHMVRCIAANLKNSHGASHCETHAKFLLENGARSDIKDHNDKTVGDMAKESRIEARLRALGMVH